MVNPRALLASLNPARSWRTIAALLAEHGCTMTGAAWRLAARGEMSLSHAAIGAICAACGVEPPPPDAAILIKELGITHAIGVAEQPNIAILARVDGHLTQVRLGVSKTQPDQPPRCRVSATYGRLARRKRTPVITILPAQLATQRPQTRHGHTVHFEALTNQLQMAARSPCAKNCPWDNQGLHDAEALKHSQELRR